MKFVVIYNDDDIIQYMEGSDNYLEAVGMAYTRFLDTISDFEEDGYHVERKSEFYDLEADTGWGWTAWFDKDMKFTIYLLRSSK